MPDRSPGLNDILTKLYQKHLHSWFAGLQDSGEWLHWIYCYEPGKRCPEDWKGWTECCLHQCLGQTGSVRRLYKTVESCDLYKFLLIQNCICFMKTLFLLNSLSIKYTHKTLAATSDKKFSVLDETFFILVLHLCCPRCLLMCLYLCIVKMGFLAAKEQL